MADDAKNPAADQSAAEKGQAKDETNLPPKAAEDKLSDLADSDNTDSKNETPAAKKDASSEDNSATKKTKSKKNKKSTKATTNAAQAAAQPEVAGTKDTEVTAENTQKSEESTEANSAEVDTTAETTQANTIEVDATDKANTTAETSPAATDATIDSDFQAEIRDQIENCKFEIVAALQESVHSELKHVMQNQIRKTERRRVFGVVIRDILILILIVIAGFFAYRLYEYGEFKFLFPACDQDSQSSACENQATEPEQPEPEPEIIKDLAWYRKNYGNLFDNLQTHLDADKVSAYYLYSGDYKVDDIAPEYLLSMAYNQLSPSTNNILTVPAADLRTAFVDTFGNANSFVKKSFTYDCLNFNYDKANDIFTAPDLACTQDSSRQILEDITDIYEEGNALYFITVATIYDQSENAYYTFDNLFQPAVTNVTEDDLAIHSSLLNQYQYQFKRTDNDHFYFSSIIKLK